MASAFFDPLVGGNGTTVSDDADPVTGLRRGGYKVRFVPALQQFVAIASNTILMTNNAVGAAANALASANAADVSEANALLFRNQAETFSGAASTSASNAAASATAAALSLAGTLNAAGLSGAKAYSSYALAIADFANLVNNQPVFVVTDETRGNQGAYYRATGTPVSSLTFLRLHEFYTSPVSYVASDSVQNILTMLLVKVGIIPQDNPTLFADLGSDAYFA